MPMFIPIMYRMISPRRAYWTLQLNEMEPKLH